MIILKNKLDKNKAEGYVLGLLILFFIFRSSNPIFKYPFLILYLGFIANIIIFHRFRIRELFDTIVSNYFWILILSFIFCIAFFFSNKIYLSVFKDILNDLILFSFFIILTVFIKSKDSFLIFLNSFYKLIVVFAIFISVFGLLDSFGIVPFSDYFLIEKDSSTQFQYDYNFGLLPVIFGFIIIMFNIRSEKTNAYHPLLYVLILVLFSLFIFFSGSKRGAIVFLFLMGSSFFAAIYSLFKKDFLTLTAKKVLITYFLLIAAISFSFWLFFSKGSFDLKNNLLITFGTKELEITKEKISNNLLRYYHLVNKNIRLKQFNELIWSIPKNPVDFDSSNNYPLFYPDPLNPYSGWGGAEIHKVVTPLYGKNLAIVPQGAIGLPIDSTSKVRTWDGDAYSITTIGRTNADSTKKISASIYCYVSEDFDGSWVRLIMLYTKGKELHSDYNLNKKGSWQKLHLEDFCMNEPAEVRFYAAKMGNTDFSALNGSVIIAFPQFIKTDKNGVSENFYKVKATSARGIIDSNRILLNENKSGSVINKMIGSKAFQTEIRISSFICENASYSTSYYNLPVTKLSDHHNPWQQQHVLSGNLIPSLFLPSIFFSEISDRDPIRNWISHFISEDTTYFPYKADLHVKLDVYNIADDRISRWKFAWEIYNKEYNWNQKVFGGGFSFLNWYGYYFYKDKKKCDYPHNPFLYILLYSGILGLLLYVFLIYKVFYYYLKYLKEYIILFTIFLITYFFTFFSGGNPLDPPIMGFYILLPFFIHYIHKTFGNLPIQDLP